MISLKTATAQHYLTFFLGTAMAELVFRPEETKKLKMILDGILPCRWCCRRRWQDFFLLYIFWHPKDPLAGFSWNYFSREDRLSWEATVLAAVLISFPLMYPGGERSF